MVEVLGGLWSSVLLKADTATRSHQGLGICPVMSGKPLRGRVQNLLLGFSVLMVTFYPVGASHVQDVSIMFHHPALLL